MLIKVLIYSYMSLFDRSYRLPAETTLLTGAALRRGRKETDFITNTILQFILYL